MMDEKAVLSILQEISESTDKRIIYKQLVKIRVELIKNDEGISLFSKCLGIKKLVNLLEKPSQSILEVGLSILGNCCMNEKCRMAAFESGIVAIVVPTLSLQNTQIQMRASRLIGNLAINPKIADALQEADACFGLNNVLEDNENNFQVLTMAIRAITKLYTATKKFRNEAISYEIVKNMMVILAGLLKLDTTSDTAEETPVQEKSNTVIFRRHRAPDRTISKEKLANIIREIEKTKVEIDYEIISKPEKKSLEELFKTPNDKESLELIQTILKCLQIVTTTLHPEIARQIYGNGTGYTNLIFLSLEKSKFRPLALKVLENLSSNSWAQGFLSSNNLILYVSNLLINDKKLEVPLESNEQRYCVNIICLSSENACNRNKLKRSGVMKILLEIAKNTTCLKQLGMIIYNFYQFRYDELGLNLFLQDGLILVLIKIINDILEKRPVDHITFKEAEKDDSISDNFKLREQNRDIKRLRESSPTHLSYSSLSKYKKFDYYDPESPGSSGYGSNNFQYSPSSYSPYNSPARSNDDDDFDSDTYSPVCSDAEENEEEENESPPEPAIPSEPKKEFNIFSLIYDNSNPSEETEKEENLVDLDENSCQATSEAGESPEKSTKSSKNVEEKDESEELTNESFKLFEKDPLPYILNLVWKVSIKNNHSVDFIRPNTLDTLLKVCSVVKEPNGRVYQILENIVVQIKNFIPILKQNFTFKVHKLKHLKYEHENCFSCSKLRQVSHDLLRAFGNVAESGYGRGEIEHVLVTGDDSNKKRMAVLLTYFISTPEYLYKWMHYCKSLDIVMDLILNDEEWCVEAACGLSTMAANLGIPFAGEREGKKQNLEKFSETKHKELLTVLGKDLVKFSINEDHLYFDKDFLMKKSQVFESMFNNDFRESKMNEVHPANCSIGGLKYFFHLILLDHQKELKKIAPTIPKMSDILDAYQLSIQYIIESIQKPLLNLIKLVIDHTNALEVFEWSLKYVNHECLDVAVIYFLTSDIDGEKKVKMFRDADKSSYSAQWKHLIVDAISLRVQPTAE